MEPTMNDVQRVVNINILFTQCTQ